jgi:hypothetical protein
MGAMLTVKKQTPVHAMVPYGSRLHVTHVDIYMVKTEIGFKLGKKYLLLGW